MTGIRTFGLEDFFLGDEPPGAESVGIKGLARTVGQSTVISISGQPVQLDLSEQTIDTPFIDYIFLRSGSYSYLSHGSWVALEASLVVVPSGLVNKVRFEGMWDFVAVRLPRNATVSLTPNPPSQIGLFRSLSVLESGMQSFASTLLAKDEQLSAVEVYAVEQLLLEMGGASLLDRMGGGWTQGAPHAVILDRAKAVIAQQCADPELTPELVASEVNSSLRQLQTIFHEAKISVASEIRARRAYLARQLLRDARYDVLTVDQVAERSGFGSAVTMRRALSELYGVGPREMRLSRR